MMLKNRSQRYRDITQKSIFLLPDLFPFLRWAIYLIIKQTYDNFGLSLL
jgi:hypothetical protein